METLPAAPILARIPGDGSGRPRDLKQLNAWLGTWTTIRVARLRASDGGELYFYGIGAERMKGTIVATVFEASELSFDSWLSEIAERNPNAVAADTVTAFSRLAWAADAARGARQKFERTGRRAGDSWEASFLVDCAIDAARKGRAFLRLLSEER
jgi:hypothetical protein